MSLTKKYSDYSLKKPKLPSEGSSMFMRNLLPEAFACLEKFYQLVSPIFEEPIKEAIMREVIWTEEEMCNRLKEFEKGSGSPFWNVLVSRVRSSIAGQFLTDFNGGVTENQQIRELQLDVVKKILWDGGGHKDYESMNNIVDNIFSVLTKLFQIVGDKPIDLKTFLDHLDLLRLCDSKIGYFDQHLSRLNNLLVLILSGNVIEEMRLDWLPTSLRVLELHNNLISEIRLSRKVPPPLIYLGLSTNSFSNESSMEGLSSLRKLCVLDLGDNNFSDFFRVFDIIRKCNYLECICLKGNPLSTVVSYKDIIKTSFPKLHQLDGVSLFYDTERDPIRKTVHKETIRRLPPKKEKEKRSDSKTYFIPGSLCYTAELRIHIFRMTGIPKPSLKTKKSKGYYQFEVQLPLLDQKYKIQKKCRAMFKLLKQCGITPKSDSSEEINEPSKYESRSLKESRSVRTTMGEKVKSKEQWEIEYEEFLANDIEEPGACRILSDKIRWANVIKPNAPIATVAVSSANLNSLRYTLRSIIVIRLYYYSEVSEIAPAKKLIAKIAVPGQEPHWKEDYCNYEWNAKQPQIAAFLPTSTKVSALGFKGKQRSKSNTGFMVPTCHLGISLLRST